VLGGATPFCILPVFHAHDAHQLTWGGGAARSGKASLPGHPIWAIADAPRCPYFRSMTHHLTTDNIPTRSLSLPEEPSLPPDHTYCARCSTPTLRDAARPVHVRLHIARWPLRTFHCGEAPARRWRPCPPSRYLCPRCAPRARPSDGCVGGPVAPDTPTVLALPSCSYCRPSRPSVGRTAVPGVPAPLIALRPGVPPGWGAETGAGGAGGAGRRGCRC